MLQVSVDACSGSIHGWYMQSTGPPPPHRKLMANMAVDANHTSIVVSYCRRRFGIGEVIRRSGTVFCIAQRSGKKAFRRLVTDGRLLKQGGPFVLNDFGSL
jgi:hypothetical protein